MGFLFDRKYSHSGNRFLLITEAYLERSWKSTMRLFSKNSLKAVHYFCQSFIVDIRLGSKYASVLPANEWIYKVFSVKLSDNSKILIVLSYPYRSTIQWDKLKNRATLVK